MICGTLRYERLGHDLNKIITNTECSICSQDQLRLGKYRECSELVLVKPLTGLSCYLKQAH